jgi:hypothetical protein
MAWHLYEVGELSAQLIVLHVDYVAMRCISSMKSISQNAKKWGRYVRHLDFGVTRTLGYNQS